MRRRCLLKLSNEGISASKAQPCDICLCNKTTKKLLIVEAAKFSTTDYPSTAYSPVGVVVIPGSHNVYGDGSCGVMSIVPMSCDTPDTGGTSEEFICWGSYGTDIGSLPNLNKVCHVGSEGTVHSTVQGTTNNAYLPSDKFDTVENPYDADTYYYYNEGERYYAPSPFLTDGSRNPAYYQTSSPSSTSNALADFDGVGNTNILTVLATSLYDWKTATKITNNPGGGYYPAACCCWRYHTDGTSQGDWYLPSMGELGYIMPNFNKINTTINTLSNAYGVGVQLNSLYFYWSSSESAINAASIVNTGDGNASNIDKRGGNDVYVRAFLRIK